MHLMLISLTSAPPGGERSARVSGKFYRPLRMNETPIIEVHLVRNLEAPGGIGEPGTSVTAAALANAIFAATGKRIRKLPLVSAFKA